MREVSSMPGIQFRGVSMCERIYPGSLEIFSRVRAEPGATGQGRGRSWYSLSKSERQSKGEKVQRVIKSCDTCPSSLTEARRSLIAPLARDLKEAMLRPLFPPVRVLGELWKGAQCLKQSRGCAREEIRKPHPLPASQLCSADNGRF